MSKTISFLTTGIIACLFAASCPRAFAQFSYDLIVKNSNVEVKLTLKDAQTDEPLPWVSVYLTNAGDTTITNFALSDEKGNVKLKDVPAGKYELNAELIGYLPYKKEHTFKGWQADLGIIKLKENPEFIDAASISAVGNPVVIKKDTIEYNASSFKVGENAMLEDLLKRMPGMEVSSDGTVKVNGEQVDKITVGGKTFFFNDPTVAVKNLPAKIVNKIRVIDKDKDEAAFTGVSTKEDKEKVMDVELKEEYKKGWFGNAKAGGGSTLTGKAEDPLTDGRGALYNANVMMSAYGEKDQLVLLGNALNVDESEEQMYVFRGASQMGGVLNGIGGLTTSRLAGANYNTSRIPGMDTDASVTYKYNAKDNATRSFRTSLRQDAPDLLTESSVLNGGKEDAVSIALQLKNKNTKKAYFNLNPWFSYSDGYSTNSSRSASDDASGNRLNSSESDVLKKIKSFSTIVQLHGGLKDIGDKKGRSVVLSLSTEMRFDDGSRNENSETVIGENVQLKNLLYDIDNDYKGFSGRASYTEPLGKRWRLRLMAESKYISRSDVQDAFRPDGSEDDYYSSYSRNNYLANRGMLQFQFSTDTTELNLGLTCTVYRNETSARSLGVESVTGKDEWRADFAPAVNWRYKAGNSNLMILYSANTNQASNSKLKPVLDISNPVRITAGNVYLGPALQHTAYINYRFNNREKFTYFGLSMSANLTQREEVDAVWFDSDGVRYSVPVNAKKPNMFIYFYPSFNQPFGKNRHFTLSMSGSLNYNRNISYQAVSQLDGLDVDAFDYYEFMSGFYGNSRGDRFYSGESGFRESTTSVFSWDLTAKLKYSIDKFDVTAGYMVSNDNSRYSINKDAGLCSWRHSAFADLLYQPGKGWEFSTKLSYNFFRGYSSGYGDPEWRWNISAGKSIKAFTLSLRVQDVLNQSRNLRQRVTNEYLEDVYSKILGRYFIASVAFNFGKMNAGKNAKVRDAMFNMMM